MTVKETLSLIGLLATPVFLLIDAIVRLVEIFKNASKYSVVIDECDEVTEEENCEEDDVEEAEEEQVEEEECNEDVEEAEEEQVEEETSDKNKALKEALDECFNKGYEIVKANVDGVDYKITTFKDSDSCVIIEHDNSFRYIVHPLVSELLKLEDKNEMAKKLLELGQSFDDHDDDFAFEDISSLISSSFPLLLL